MNAIIIFLVTLLSLTGCSSYSGNKERTPSQTSDVMIEFFSTEISTSDLANALSRKIRASSVEFVEIKRPLNIIKYTAAFVTHTDVGYIATLRIDDKHEVNCSMYEHNPGGVQVIAFSTCKGTDDALSSFFIEDVYHLHVPMAEIRGATP